MQCPFIPRRPITTSAARRAHAAGLRVSPPHESQPAQWRLRVGHAKTGCALLEGAARTSHHGLAPKERGPPPVRCPSISLRQITASAARRTRAASLRVLPPPERHPAQWRWRACHANAGCTLEVTARTSHHGLAWKERGLPPVQCPSIVRRPITASAARRARAATSHVLPPRERQPAQWRSRVGHAKAGCVLGGHSSRVASRSCTEGKRHSARAMPFHIEWPVTISATRHARAATSRVLPPPETQPAQWRSRVGHAKAGCALEVTARTSHHGLARKKRGLPPVQCHSIVRITITTSVARHARAASSRVSPPPEKQPAQWRLRACHANAGCALEVTARTSHHGIAPKKRDLSPMQCPFISRGPIAASAARLARAASSCVSPPPERQPAQWRLRACHANAGCALKATARTSHHGLAPKERGLLPVQCPSIAQGPIAASAARRARGKLACFATS